MSDTPQSPQPQAAPSTPEESEAARRAGLPAAAQRALAEADARRANNTQVAPAPELGGRDGPEPVRYGDWEKKGLAIDF